LPPSNDLDKVMVVASRTLRVIHPECSSRPCGCPT
jgi:hypothetical protein